MIIKYKEYGVADFTSVEVSDDQLLTAAKKLVENYSATLDKLLSSRIVSTEYAQISVNNALIRESVKYSDVLKELTKGV